MAVSVSHLIWFTWRYLVFVRVGAKAFEDLLQSARDMTRRPIRIIEVVKYPDEASAGRSGLLRFAAASS